MPFKNHLKAGHSAETFATKVKDGINYRRGCVVYAHLFKWEWLKTQTCLPKKQPADYNNFWLQSASVMHELYMKDMPACYYFSVR